MLQSLKRGRKAPFFMYEPCVVAFVTAKAFTYTSLRFVHRNTAMKLRYLFVLLCMTHVGWAKAEIYKSVDSQGRVTYSSTPIKGAKKLNLEPLPTMQAPSSHTESESKFPSVNQETQRNRDDTRRKILEDELAAEQKQLDQARQNLQLAQDTPMVYRGKDGKTYRNVAKYDANVKTAQDAVSLHERNINAIKTELSRLK